MKKKPNIAILGYGAQGRALALNLKDAGWEVIVGLPSKSRSRRFAKSDGIENITAVGQAVKNAPLALFAFPDHLHGRIFDKEIRPNLKDGSTLIFLHGFSIHFKTIVPPDNSNVLLLAPLAPGTAVREKFLQKKSVGYFYSVHQDTTGEANKILDKLTRALRIDKKTMINTSFEDEAIGDLFGEQAVLCGGLSQLIKNGYDTLVEFGLSSDKAYLEVAYQMDLIINLIKNFGIEGMFRRISIAARYGSYLNGPEIIDKTVKKRMKDILGEIKNGNFADKLNTLTEEDIKELDDNLKKLSSPSFEKSAKKFSSVKNRK